MNSNQQENKVSSGLGRPRSVCVAWMDLVDNGSEIQHDVKELGLSVGELEKTDRGRAALRAVACSILNLDIEETGRMYFVTDDGLPTFMPADTPQAVKLFKDILLSR